ncbi:MAG: tRNA lysidine(34) synthetase TilS, partial [Bacteroidia bacterium]
MLHDPESFISRQRLFSKKDKLLIAFSGGSDSVALAHLLHSTGYSVSLAHCNFGLRGKESDGDEAFCRSFAKKAGLDFFSKRFDTTGFAKENELSIQMAARQLRYDWFAELLSDKSFDYILTAHHANDNIETLLINLVRGTGINGLSGIPQQQQSVIRPLLHVTREDILNYIKKHKLSFRDDSSNDEVKYKRNFLRHEIIPRLKQLNPSLEATFEQNIKLFSQAGAIVRQFVNEKRHELVTEQDGQTTIDVKKLLKDPHKELLLHEFLSPFGFNPAQTADILKSAGTKQPGKLFFSIKFRALIDRSHLIVSHIKQQEKA